MTLDEADDAFQSAPAENDNAATYVAVAAQYWQDEMIATGTFGEIVRQCSGYII